MSTRAAATPVIMPKLGAYTEDILLVQWLVEEGQDVAAGQVVLELETEKTNAEVEADSAGFIHRLVAAGESVPIGTTVGLIAATREEYDELAGGTTLDDTGPDDTRPGDTEGENGHPFLGYIGHGGGATVAQTAGVAAPEPPYAVAAPAHAARGDGPLIAPRARALMKELGLPPEVAREIEGSGPGGRILDRDVAVWAAARESAPRELTVTRLIPLRGRRKTIATRMVDSLQTAAQLTSVLELDVKPLVELRTSLNEGRTERRIGVTAIVVKLVAAALREHPGLNARVTDSEIELFREINVAVAVETDEGLVAPVVAGAERLSIEQIDERIAGLATRARANALEPDDLAGGTFTVSNGGIHPVDITTAILNPPQVGILWIGRIKERPVALEGGAIAVRPTMQACLTFDHRAIDGGPAAAFLATLESLVAALADVPR